MRPSRVIVRSHVRLRGTRRSGRLSHDRSVLDGARHRDVAVRRRARACAWGFCRVFIDEAPQVGRPINLGRDEVRISGRSDGGILVL